MVPQVPQQARRHCRPVRGKNYVISSNASLRGQAFWDHNNYNEAARGFQFQLRCNVSEYGHNLDPDRLSL